MTFNSGRFVGGQTPWNKGKTHPAVAGSLNPMKRPEVTTKLVAARQARGNYAHTNITKKKLRKAQLSRLLSEETKRHIGENVFSSPKYREGLQRRVLPPNAGQFRKGEAPRYSSWMKGGHASPATEFTSESARQRWRNPQFRASMLAILHSPVVREKAFAGRRVRPNKLEQRFATIITESQLPFRYTGDGTFWVGGKNPDFISTAGRQACVEVAGRYFHDDGYEQNRNRHFAKHGWMSVVIWEEELKDPAAVLAKIGRII